MILYKLHNKLSCVSSQSSSSCRVCRSMLFDKLDAAKMLDTSNVSSRVETWRAEWNLGYSNGDNLSFRPLRVGEYLLPVAHAQWHMSKIEATCAPACSPLTTAFATATHVDNYCCHVTVACNIELVFNCTLSLLFANRGRVGDRLFLVWYFQLSRAEAALRRTARASGQTVTT